MNDDRVEDALEALIYALRESKNHSFHVAANIVEYIRDSLVEGYELNFDRAFEVNQSLINREKF